MILLKRKATKPPKKQFMKPLSVLHNWNIPGLADLDTISLKKPESGLLNKTFLFRAGETGNDLFVLQAVHPAVSMDGAMHNYFHVTQFLQQQGFTTQTVVPTRTGTLWVDDNADKSWRWRLLRGVEGEIFTSPTLALAKEAGKVLAITDVALSQYDRALEDGRKSHHYEREFDKLHSYQTIYAANNDLEIQQAGALLHMELPKLLLPKDLPQRIIHADPKISNFVFTQDEKGVCMIDFDTIQTHTPLFEIADAVRSWCSQKEDAVPNQFDVTIYNELVQSYLSHAGGMLSAKEQALIPQACKLVILGLATRFLNDYIDDSYFGWDETRYETRKAHNKARALGQISLYQSVIKFI